MIYYREECLTIYLIFVVFSDCINENYYNSRDLTSKKFINQEIFKNENKGVINLLQKKRYNLRRDLKKENYNFNTWQNRKDKILTQPEKLSNDFNKIKSALSSLKSDYFMNYMKNDDFISSDQQSISESKQKKLHRRFNELSAKELNNLYNLIMNQFNIKNNYKNKNKTSLIQLNEKKQKLPFNFQENYNWLNEYFDSLPNEIQNDKEKKLNDIEIYDWKNYLKQTNITKKINKTVSSNESTTLKIFVPTTQKKLLTTMGETTKRNYYTTATGKVIKPIKQPTFKYNLKYGSRFDMLQCHPPKGKPKNPVELPDPNDDINYHKALTGKLPELIIEEIYNKILKDDTLAAEFGICQRDLDDLREVLSASPVEKNSCCFTISDDLKCFLKWVLYQEPAKKKRGLRTKHPEEMNRLFFKTNEKSVWRKESEEIKYPSSTDKMPVKENSDWYEIEKDFNAAFRELIDNDSGCL